MPASPVSGVPVCFGEFGSSVTRASRGAIVGGGNVGNLAFASSLGDNMLAC